MYRDCKVNRVENVLDRTASQNEILTDFMARLSVICFIHQ